MQISHNFGTIIALINDERSSIYNLRVKKK